MTAAILVQNWWQVGLAVIGIVAFFVVRHADPSRAAMSVLRQRRWSLSGRPINGGRGSSVTDQRVTAASITMIPIIIAIAVALAGFLMVNKIASNERSQCDELAQVFDERNHLTPGSDGREVMDSIRVVC